MKTFLLNSTPQTEAFLTEKRKDPVTSETFKEGDEIVFCASCKSAFLKESWEYMGGEHCGQSGTLENFLQPPEDRLFLMEKGGETLIEFPHTHAGSYFSLKEITGLRLYILIICALASPGAFGLSLFAYFSELIAYPSLVLSAALSFSVAVTSVIYATFRKGAFLRNELRCNGLLIRDKYFPYQNIAECRVSFHTTHKMSEPPRFGGIPLLKPERVHMNSYIKIMLFFHEKEESHIFIIDGLKNSKRRTAFLETLLLLSDKLRLTFSSHSFCKEDNEFIRQKAKETGRTYYKKSLYYKHV